MFKVTALSRDTNPGVYKSFDCSNPIKNLLPSASKEAYKSGFFPVRLYSKRNVPFAKGIFSHERKFLFQNFELIEYTVQSGNIAHLT